MIRYFSLIHLSICFLALSLSAKAGSSVKSAIPSVKDDALPRSYQDLHPSTGIRLSFLNAKNVHKEVNPIFTDDWELPSFDIKTAKQADRVQTFVSGGRSVGSLGKADLSHLARLTAYWGGEAGDSYTGRHISSTGIHLHVGHCAVDPNVIPYGSVVQIPGVGVFLAVDTGSAVVLRTAARAAAHTTAERGALVIDLFFESQSDGQEFASHGPSYVTINWWTPASTDHKAKVARSLFADEDWNKIYNKQL